MVIGLEKLGFTDAGSAYLPEKLYSIKSLLTLKTWLILIAAGLLIGFGTRYAGGCTSGHAISGLSALQLPSLLAVIGFFAGGLIMGSFSISSNFLNLCVQFIYY